MPVSNDDPLVVQVADDFRAALIAAEQTQSAVIAQKWLSVENTLQIAINELAEEAFSGGTGLSVSQIFKLRSWAVLSVQVTAEITRFLVDIEPQLNAAHAVSATSGAMDAFTLTQLAIEQVGAGALDVTPMRLNTAAVENLVAIARAGQPLGDLMSLAYGDAADGMLNELIEGSALGLNPRETARLMTQEGLVRGFSHVELVARDQQNRAYRLASQQQYAQSDVLSGFQRIASKDSRTCLACLALDGTLHETSEFIAVHPTDRCSMIPTVRGFPPVQFQTGKEWFDGLAPDQQRAIMGPGRHAAYQDGLFEFEDMAKVSENDVWGPSAQVKPLAELVEA